MNATTFDSAVDINEKLILDEKSSFSLGHRPELDGFRGISILLVLVHHFYYPMLSGGFLGVDMFFVLSGFLITSLLLEEWQKFDTISLKNFYIRRLFRLMPALIFIITLLGIYALLFLDGKSAEKTFLGIWLTFSYVSNWFYAFDPSSANNPLGVTWSLAIEEQFYLIFPLILLLVLRLKFSFRQIIAALIVLIIGIALHRKNIADNYGFTARLYYASDTRADALLIGCLVAFLFSWKIDIFKKFASFFRIAAALSLVFIIVSVSLLEWCDIFLYDSGGYTFIAIAVGFLIISLTAYKPKRTVNILSCAPLVWIGRVSYGLYLWHWAIRWYLYGDAYLPASSLQLLLAIVLSFAFTILSYFCVEKPFLKLKDRYSKNRKLVHV